MTMRKDFEQWYVDNAHDYAKNPIGSRDCALQWASWQACAARMEWQPIETAPKDGVVLLCLPIFGAIREGDRRVYEGRWHNEQDTFTSVNGFILLTGATHWMPLPSAPEGKK